MLHPEPLDDVIGHHSEFCLQDYPLPSKDKSVADIGQQFI